MNLDNHSTLVVLIAGVSFFMFGMSLASKALEKMMANRVRELLGKISKNHFLTIGIGIVLTIGLQSSGAVTSMLVGLGSAGVIKLPQVMGIILGAAIGSTITVQLISFNVSQFGLPVFATAFTFYFMTKNRALKNLLSVFMGFGLIFFGLEFIGLSAKAIQEIPYLEEAFQYLSQYPYVAFAASIVFTGLVHSSAVTIGLASTLALHGLVGYQDAMYWVLGANVGTASTALMASVGGGYVGRQVAWAHLIYRVLSALLFLTFINSFAGLVAQLASPIGGEVTRDIANAHTIFNLLAALIFMPFIGLGSRWIEKIFAPRDDEQEFTTEFLQTNDYHSTTLALAYARRELMRMGDIVQSMIEDSIDLFKQDDPELLDSIADRDNRVDLLQHEIKLFLVKYSSESNEDTTKAVFKLISFANDLESAADVIDNSMADLARKKQTLKLDFSNEGWNEVKSIHRLVVQAGQLSLSSFQAKDSTLAAELIHLKREIRKVEKKLKLSHIERLNQGLEESINTSSIHLDLLGAYRRIVGMMTNHAYSLVKSGRRKSDDKTTKDSRRR